MDKAMMHRELDSVADTSNPTSDSAYHLIAVVEALDSNTQLRRALTDTALSPDQRADLAARLFADRLDAAGMAVVQAAARFEYDASRGLADAISREANRLLLMTCQDAELARRQLFEFGRLVAADLELSRVIDDPARPLAERQALIAKLLGPNAEPVAVTLVQRAAATRHEDFQHQIVRYVKLASSLRGHLSARVKVARPMTAEQIEALHTQMARIYGQPVDFDIEVVPELIGGVRVIINDDIIDGSVAGKLAAARQELAAN